MKLGALENDRGLQVGCTKCPLRELDHFRKFSPEELAFVQKFKTGLLNVAAGGAIIVEGEHSPHIYTVLSGWGFRYKTLEDGRRQILNFLLPGDLVGLQTALFDEMQHSAEAISDMHLCVFERRRLHELFSGHAGLAFDITWLTARSESMLDENLLAVGRRSALERVAYLVVFLYQRAKSTRLLSDNERTIPITQQHIADMLGLSLVHTNKTLKKLSARKMIRWIKRGYEVLDEDGLLEIAEWEGLDEKQRPYI